MKKFLVYLVAFMFVLSMGGTAFAGWSTTNSALTARTVLVGGATTSLSPVAAGGTAMYYTVGGEQLAAQDFITITLTGGATFVGPTAPPMLTPPTGINLGSGNGGQAIPFSGGTAGSTSATWRVTNTNDPLTGDTYTFNSASAIFNLNAVPVNPTGGTSGVVDFVMTMTTGGGIAIFSPRSFATQALVVPFTGVTGEDVSVVATTNEARVEATTGPFTKFANAGTIGTPATLSFTNKTGVNTLPASISNTAAKVLFILAGNFTGITSVSGTGCTASSSTGTPSAASTTTTNFFGIVGEYAYCVNTEAITTGTGRVLAPTFTINGTTSQAARGFTATVNVLADVAGWNAHEAKAATAIYSITRNGVSGYLYNITSPDNTNSVSIIRVTNNGTIAGKIYGTLTLNNGTAYTGTLITSLAGGQTVQLNSTEIGAALAPGIVWTGTRARLALSSETSMMNVQGTVQQALSTGYNNTNFSTVAPKSE